jgi:diguanylate cyclase (GGDEF)-like protein
MVKPPFRSVFAVATVVIVALAIGIFVGSLAGWIVVGTILASVALYVFFVVRDSGLLGSVNPWSTQKEHEQPFGSTMKKLLFDDFQSSVGNYVVREIEDEEHVVPSTKAAEPAPLTIKEEAPREIQLLDFFDLESEETLADIEPKSEFHSLLNKVLLVLKDVLFAHTVAFFWANREKGKMVVESMATESDRFIQEKRFPIEGDLVSLVAQSGKPELIGDISAAAEAELLRYYSSQAGVRSVVAVPVFFRTGSDDIQPVGVLVGDSRAEDAFGNETLGLLGRFTKLVSALIKSYIDKYDLLLDSELLTSIRRLQDRVKSDPSEETILAALSDELNRLAGWDCLTITMYSDEQKGWVVQKVVNKLGGGYVDVGQPVDVAGGLAGNAVRNNKVEMVPDLSTSSAFRFHEGEEIDATGSFLALPISSFNRCYGALCLESRNVANFSGSEVETVYRLIENAAASLEVVYMNSLVREYVSVDHLTGSMTQKHFLRALNEEVRRAEDFDEELALVSIAVDNFPDTITRYGNETVEVVLRELGKVVRSHIRSYDILGLLEEEKLGVLLVNTTASDAYLWAEKIRKMVASHTIAVAGRTFSVTISVGVCGLSEGMGSGELMAGTARVLEKAIETGGNLVRVF